MTTASVTPLGASQPTGGPGGSVVVVAGIVDGVACMVVAVGVAVLDEDDAASLVMVGLVLTPAQAAVTRTMMSGPIRRRIDPELWHLPASNRRKLASVFGPLNGVRTALVIAALLAALVCLVVGYPFAAAVLAIGVAIHGLGWLYLYTTRDRP
ncbi:MAG: hypothetical protein WAL25_02150 [Acidimicrobiia bacterium]